MENIRIETKNLDTDSERSDILNLLDQFDEISVRGFLKPSEDSDNVYVVTNSDADTLLKRSIEQKEGYVFPTGELEHNGTKYLKYTAKLQHIEGTGFEKKTDSVQS